MALVDYFRGERIRGRVIDVYNTDKNHLGAVVEADNGSRYTVNFSMGNNIFNLYGLFAPLSDRRQNLERLIKPEVYIDVATDYSKNPFKAAYKLNQVSSQPIYNQQASRAIAYG
jgi:hypothetical protein